MGLCMQPSWWICTLPPVGAEPEMRPFDVPWLVLDSSLARRVWSWAPQTSLETIWTEIAEHAGKHPDWLEMTADS